jgi:hypothetical protein
MALCSVTFYLSVANKPFKPSGVMLNVLSVICGEWHMLSVANKPFMLSSVILNVIVLNVVFMLRFIYPE